MEQVNNVKQKHIMFATAVLIVSSISPLTAAENKTREDIMSLSIGPNLFIDDYLIAESRDLKRTAYQPEKHPTPVFHVTPGNVSYDSDGRRFRMLYIENGQYALAESANGIDWQKPELGLVDAAGSRRNNFIDAPRGGFQGQFLDDGPSSSDPARRHKLALFRDGKGLCVAFSSDGLRFTEFTNNPVIPENANSIPVGKPGSESVISDVINGCWDPLKQEYLIICKMWEGGYPGKPHHADAGYRRVVGMTTSKDFVAWEKTRIIVRPDPKNGLEEFYSFSPMVRGNLYIGFLHVLRDDLAATAGSAMEGIGWTELVTSRDGRNWSRHQEKFLDRDPEEGQFGHAMAWCGDSVVVGDKEYFYYVALLSGHKTDRRNGRKSGLAILRKNGFVSRDAGSKGGFLKTHLAVLPGKGLTVNAVIRGQLRVRLVNADRSVLPGFDWTDCVDLRGDSVAHRVKWQAHQSVPKGAVVSLEFELKDAELYGFDFAD